MNDTLENRRGDFVHPTELRKEPSYRGTPLSMFYLTTEQLVTPIAIDSASPFSPVAVERVTNFSKHVALFFLPGHELKSKSSRSNGIYVPLKGVCWTC